VAPVAADALGGPLPLQQQLLLLLHWQQLHPVLLLHLQQRLQPAAA
jgi:hypothetical protein